MYKNKAEILKFPEELKNVELQMGIDEAGRGPVLGPMIYCGCIAKLEYDWPEEINDSKKLTPEKRADLLTMMKDLPLGFAIRELKAEEISGNVLRLTNCVNLNEISHLAAIELIQLFLDSGANIKKIFVDPVGPSASYQKLLTKHFLQYNIQFTVKEKADSLYKCVGAASICAKVSRDSIVNGFQFEEKNLKCSKEFGSGYPSDPYTTSWLQNSFNPFFGFPSIVRFSWETINKYFKTDNRILFEEDLTDENKPSKYDSFYMMSLGLKNFTTKKT